MSVSFTSEPSRTKPKHTDPEVAGDSEGPREDLRKTLKQLDFDQAQDLLTPQDSPLPRRASLKRLEGSGNTRRLVELFGALGNTPEPKPQRPQVPRPEQQLEEQRQDLEEQKRDLETEQSQGGGDEEHKAELQEQHDELQQQQEELQEQPDEPQEEHEDGYDELLRQQQASRAEELEQLRQGGDQQYLGQGQGLLLRRLIMDPRLGYQLDRTVDEKSKFGRYKSKAVSAPKETLTEGCRFLGEAVTSKRGAKRGLRKAGNLAINQVPLVAPVRAGQTARKERKRQKVNQRLALDDNLGDLGQNLSAGLGAKHKIEKKKQATKVVGGLAGAAGQGVVGRTIKLAGQAGVSLQEQRRLKGRTTRISARLRSPEEMEQHNQQRVEALEVEGTTRTNKLGVLKKPSVVEREELERRKSEIRSQTYEEHVDEANQNISKLASQDPAFAEKVLNHLLAGPMGFLEELTLSDRLGDSREERVTSEIKSTRKGRLKRKSGSKMVLYDEHGQEISQRTVHESGRHATGQAVEQHLLRPSEVKKYSDMEKARLALRRSLGAQDSWKPEDQKDIDSHNELIEDSPWKLLEEDTEQAKQRVSSEKKTIRKAEGRGNARQFGRLCSSRIDGIRAQLEGDRANAIREEQAGIQDAGRVRDEAKEQLEQDTEVGLDRQQQRLDEQKRMAEEWLENEQNEIQAFVERDRQTIDLALGNAEAEYRGALDQTDRSRWQKMRGAGGPQEALEAFNKAKSQHTEDSRAIRFRAQRQRAAAQRMYGSRLEEAQARFESECDKLVEEKRKALQKADSDHQRRLFELHEIRKRATLQAVERARRELHAIAPPGAPAPGEPEQFLASDAPPPHNYLADLWKNEQTSKTEYH